MEVKIISRETVKPSSPTPPHLRTFKISLADKLNLPVYFNFISFYRKKDGVVVNHDQLKRSLSETLSRFYPLAGRLRDDDDTVDCNDKGAMYCIARVNCTMTELLAHPKSELFYQFAPPLPPTCPRHEDGPAQIAIQLNEFACGGVALCVCFSHKIIDVVTMVGVVKCWAAIANGSPSSITKTMYPDYQAGESLFPQREEESLPSDLLYPVERTLLREGKGIVKRFVFEGGAISTLRANAKSQRVPSPSRVEALSAFIWKRCMAASTAVWGSQQPSMVCHAVDLRRRMVPPLSEYSGGNLLSKTLAYCDAATAAEIQVDGLVGILREEFEKVKDHLVPKLQNVGGGFRVIREHLEEVREKCSDKNLNSYIFSSWCRMGHNEVDFGWGKPIWVSQMGGDEVDSIYKNIVIMMDGETSDKIEAWIILDQREMAVLESDSEFIAFASPNPPIFV